jgi:hypothetical protein
MSNLIKLVLSESEVNVILNNLKCILEYKDYLNKDLKANRSKYINTYMFFESEWKPLVFEKLKFADNLLYVHSFIGTGACVNTSPSLLEVYWLTTRNVLVKDKPLEIFADSNTYHGLTTLLSVVIPDDLINLKPTEGE